MYKTREKSDLNVNREWGLRKQGFNPRLSHTKDSKKKKKKKKRYLIPPCLTLSIIRYGSRLSGAIQRKEKRLSQYFGVETIEKGAFWLSSTTVANFTYINPEQKDKQGKRKKTDIKRVT